MSKDTIYRQDAVSEIHKYFFEEIEKTPHGTDEDGEDVYTDMPTVNSLLAHNKQLSKRIKALPSAHPELDEWCYDCKEYDKEKHSCPRWNRVIRNTLKDAQPEIICCKNCVNAEERGCALFCGFWTRYTAHKGYCFKAERREE